MNVIIAYFKGYDYGFFISVAKEAKIWCQFLGYEYVTDTPIPDDRKNWSFILHKWGLPTFVFQHTDIISLDMNDYKFVATGELIKLNNYTFKRFYNMAKELHGQGEAPKPPPKSNSATFSMDQPFPITPHGGDGKI